MAKFYLGSRSIHRLSRVHPDLAAVVRRAIQITEVDFAVIEGARNEGRQAELVAAGASQTMRSRHLIQANGWACAVDLGAYVTGEVRWDWPLYDKIAEAMKASAKELGVPIEWGGDWDTFKDGPHFQLPWKEYP